MNCNFGDIVLLNDLSLKYNNALIHLLFNFTVYMWWFLQITLKNTWSVHLKLGQGSGKCWQLLREGRGWKCPKTYWHHMWTLHCQLNLKRNEALIGLRLVNNFYCHSNFTAIVLGGRDILVRVFSKRGLSLIWGPQQIQGIPILE